MSLYVSLSLSVSLPLYMDVSLSLALYVAVCVYVTVYLSVSVYVSVLHHFLCVQETGGPLLVPSGWMVEGSV